MGKGRLARGILKSAVIALIPTLFFGIVALISPIGQRTSAEIYSFERHYESTAASDNVYAVVEYGYTASFNPMLYPLSWILGRGSVSGDFSMIYLPDWMTPTSAEGEQYTIPVWGTREQIQDEAEMKVVLEELLLNLPILPAVFFAIELAGERRLYLWILGGTVGFVFGSLIGSLAAFFSVAFLTIFLLPKLRSRYGSRLESVESKAAEA